MSSYLELTKLRQWPYKTLTKADQHVVARFFDSAPFFAYGWDMLVYLHYCFNLKLTLNDAVTVTRPITETSS